MTLKRLAAKITLKIAHLITLSDEKSGNMLFRALKTGFVEKKGQLGPLSVISKTQMSVRLFVSCQLTPFRPSVIIIIIVIVVIIIIIIIIIIVIIIIIIIMLCFN